MKMQKLENLGNKIGLTGCKWSSLKNVRYLDSRPLDCRRSVAFFPSAQQLAWESIRPYNKWPGNESVQITNSMVTEWPNGQ